MPSVSVFFRHVAAITFLIVSGQFLSAWYQFHQTVLYLAFAGFFAAALLLAGWSQYRKLLSNQSFTRLLPVIALLILALPWGEWFRLNFATSREDWSRQIFQQAVFIYLCLLLFGAFPQIAVRIHQYAKTLLTRASEAKLVWCIPVLFFCLSTGIALFVMDCLPLVQDSASYLFQAKIFSRLKLSAPAPPVSEFFTHAGDMLIIKDGRWFSMYLPGYAALLAIPMLLHAEWLLSPLLGALTVFIWMQYAIRWHSRPIAFLVGLLCLLSPFLFLMSSTVLVHPLELFIASSVLYALPQRNRIFFTAPSDSALLSDDLRNVRPGIFTVPVSSPGSCVHFLEQTQKQILALPSYSSNRHACRHGAYLSVSVEDYRTPVCSRL